MILDSCQSSLFVTIQNGRCWRSAAFFSSSQPDWLSLSLVTHEHGLRPLNFPSSGNLQLATVAFGQLSQRISFFLRESDTIIVAIQHRAVLIFLDPRRLKVTSNSESYPKAETRWSTTLMKS